MCAKAAFKGHLCYVKCTGLLLPKPVALFFGFVASMCDESQIASQTIEFQSLTLHPTQNLSLVINAQPGARLKHGPGLGKKNGLRVEGFVFGDCIQGDYRR